MSIKEGLKQTWVILDHFADLKKLHNTNLTTFGLRNVGLRNVPNLSKNRLIEWIDSSKKCIGTCIMGKFSKMNRFTVLESQNRLSTTLNNARVTDSRKMRPWIIAAGGKSRSESARESEGERNAAKLPLHCCFFLALWLSVTRPSCYESEKADLFLAYPSFY